jgi:ankyrin repeat protein
MSAKQKKAKPTMAAEKFLPPDMESLVLNENILFEASLKNDYATICGALDAKDHPLTAYLIENNLFNRRNENGKTFCDLAALVGNKEFLRTLLDRAGDKVDDNVFNLRMMLSHNNNYNFMHYACIWGRVDLCKFLVDNTKMIADPADLNDLPTNSQITINTNTKEKDKANLKSLGCVLLKTKTRIGETPLDLAKRYNNQELIEFLSFAGNLVYYFYYFHYYCYYY